jgi:hypothetical protein
MAVNRKLRILKDLRNNVELFLPAIRFNTICMNATGSRIDAENAR